MRNGRRRALGALVAIGALGIAGVLPVAAQPPGWTIVADGLAGPRGLTLGPDGTLYVAISGTGGSECFDHPVFGKACVGTSSGIVAIGTDGTIVPLVSGLPSVAFGDEAKNPTGVSHLFLGPDGAFIATVGLGGEPEYRDGLPVVGKELMGTVIRVVPGEAPVVIADLAAAEAATNPDQGDPTSTIDSNAYGVALAPDGSIWAADAGGNTIYAIDASGTLSVVAVLHATMVPAPTAPGASPDPAASPVLIPMQSVPTGIAAGPDGAAYVTQLTGAPFPLGGAAVWRIVPGEEPTVYASGFTNVVDLAFDADGSLLVLEYATNRIPSGDLTGGLWRVPAGGGTPVQIASEGLTAPGGIEVAPDGTIYVSTLTPRSGGGQILALAPGS